MRSLLQKLLLIFDDPLLEKIYTDNHFRISKSMIITNIVTDLLIIMLLMAGELFSTSPVPENVLILAGIFVALNLMSLFLHWESVVRKPLAFAIYTGSTITAIVLVASMGSMSTTRLLFIYYVISSCCRTIETLGSFAYALAFNIVIVVFFVSFMSQMNLQLLGNYIEALLLGLVPIFLGFKNWKMLVVVKDGMRSDYTFKKTYDMQSRVLETMPAGLLIAEISKVTYQSDRTRELFEYSSPIQTFDCMASIKVQSTNIILERRKDEVRFDSSLGAESERTSLNSSLSDSLMGVPHNLTLQGFLRLFLDAKFFVPNFYVEIQNALYKQKSFDFFIISSLRFGKPSAILVVVDSTFKTKKVFIEESDKYKTRVLGYISHSLKNPIHALRDALFRINDHPLVARTDDLTELVSSCIANCHLIAEMPNYIQTLIKVLSGRLVVEKCRIAIRPFLKKILADYQKHKSKMLQITYTIADDVPELVYTAPNLLSIVVKNLVSNSTKNTVRGYVNIKVESAKSRSNALSFAIKDTGRGFSKDRLEAMMAELSQQKGSFQKFSELNVGLGFKLCHLLTIILAPEGEHFEIVSEEDQGTTCSFLVDIDEVKSLKQKDQSEKSIYVDQNRLQKISYKEVHQSGCFTETAEAFDELSQDDGTLEKNEDLRYVVGENLPTFRNINEAVQSSTRINKVSSDEKSRNCPWCFDILVVDDDEMNLQLLEEHLQSDSWKVRQAYNGKEALAILKSKCLAGHPYYQSCRLIISDIEMPEMGGVELLQRLRKLQNDGELPRIPIVANTANINEFESLIGQGDNFDNLLPKPFFKEEIQSIVYKLLGKPEAHN